MRLILETWRYSWVPLHLTMWIMCSLSGSVNRIIQQTELFYFSCPFVLDVMLTLATGSAVKPSLGWMGPICLGLQHDAEHQEWTTVCTSTTSDTDGILRGCRWYGMWPMSMNIFCQEKFVIYVFFPTTYMQVLLLSKHSILSCPQSLDHIDIYLNWWRSI